MLALWCLQRLLVVWPRRAGLKPALSDLRGSGTHVAFVRDQTNSQAVLTQVLIGDKRKLTEKLTHQVEAPAAVHVVEYVGSHGQDYRPCCRRRATAQREM